MNSTSLADAARKYLDQAKDALGLRYYDLSERLGKLDDLDASLRAQAERIKADERLNQQAKQADIRAAAKAYRDAARAIVTEAQQVVEERNEQLRGKLRMPDLDAPDAQGRLANARSDAVLVLDRAPDDELGTALETLARDPGDVGHLLLSGFAERYLQARRSNTAAAMWNSKRDQLAAERLGDDAKAALGHLEALSGARNTATIMEHHAHHYAAGIEAES